MLIPPVRKRPTVSYFSGYPTAGLTGFEPVVLLVRDWPVGRDLT